MTVADGVPRIRRAAIPDDAHLVVRGVAAIEPEASIRQAVLFRRRFEAWGRYGLSAFYAAVFDLTEQVELRSDVFRGLDLAGVTLGFSTPVVYELLRIEPWRDAKGTKQYLTFEASSDGEVDRLAKEAVARGAQLLHEPYETYYGAWQAVLADPDGKPQAPHIVIAVYARGMLLHLYSRIYFDGEAANSADPVLALVPADRRATLIATRQAAGGNAVYRFDIHLQGDKETVFFDV